MMPLRVLAVYRGAIVGEIRVNGDNWLIEQAEAFRKLRNDRVRTVANTHSTSRTAPSTYLRTENQSPIQGTCQTAPRMRFRKDSDSQRELHHALYSR